MNGNSEWIKTTFERLNEKLSKTAVKSRDKLPYSTLDGLHDNMADTDITKWTNGFWGGLMWLMYKATGNEEYKKTAIRSGELLDGAMSDFTMLHHDVGFMWNLTKGAEYRITGDKAARNKALFAASLLFSRFNIDSGFIRCWNGEGTEKWSIIDTMMNIPLLYWASEEIGDDRFKKVAMKHADMTASQHVRPDGSVNHIVEHDEKTGEMLCSHTGQGYSPDSCWSRGLSWAIYGMVLSYKYTGKKEYLDAAVKTANYFIANCAMTDYLPLVDFKAPCEPKFYDSTAGACAASGMLELAKYVSEQEGVVYTDSAIKILKAIDERCCNYSLDEDSIVGMGSECYPKGDNLSVVHMPIIYGDFFFTEAILKLSGFDFLIW